MDEIKKQLKDYEVEVTKTIKSGIYKIQARDPYDLDKQLGIRKKQRSGKSPGRPRSW